jgi:tetratricopeptide (TPR) repeat protein
MTTKQPPETIVPLLDAMQAGPGESGPDCKKAAPALDWLHRHRWLGGEPDREQLEWLLAWLRHCDDPRQYEIADGLCVALLAEGQPRRAAAMADDLLVRHDDPGLMHTRALASAALGDRREAIRRLESLLGHGSFNELPPDAASQACLDLATLRQQQGALFRAIPALTQAVELAADSQEPALLVEAAGALIDQLSEQGGADEARRLLDPYLADDRLELWTLVLARLPRELDAGQRAHGMGLLVAAGDYQAALDLLVAEAAIDPERLATAFTAALALGAPAEVTGPLGARLLATEASRRQEDAPLIAAACVAVAETQREKTPAQAKWHRDGVVQLISVARHHGIPEHQVRQWVENERLYHEHGVIGRTARRLLERLDSPPGWLREHVHRLPAGN